MALFPDNVQQFLSVAGPTPTELQREMERYGRDRGFPLIGPELGGALMLFARMVEASRVFEFGSGFGYSATWFLRALPPEGEIILTEIDEDDAEIGREYVKRASETDRVTYEVGDALEVVERYDGPFDVVFVDYQKHRYVDAFDAVSEKVAPGGVVIADNIMAGPFDLDDVVAGLRGEADDLDRETRGIIDYVTHVRDAPGFESTVLPAGTGLSISHRDA